MHTESFSGDDPMAMEKMSDFFGPGHIDQLIRQAIQVCWMALPAERRTMDEVDRQVRRVVERELKDIREDAAAFLPKA